jgi:hypothetical protein
MFGGWGLWVGYIKENRRQRTEDRGQIRKKQ